MSAQPGLREPASPRGDNAASGALLKRRVVNIRLRDPDPNTLAIGRFQPPPGYEARIVLASCQFLQNEAAASPQCGFFEYEERGLVIQFPGAYIETGTTAQLAWAPGLSTLRPESALTSISSHCAAGLPQDLWFVDEIIFRFNSTSATFQFSSCQVYVEIRKL